MVDPVSQYITGQHPVKGILGTPDITRTATVPVQIYLSWELPLILVAGLLYGWLVGNVDEGISSNWTGRIPVL